jgi:hypothetical protein
MKNIICLGLSAIVVSACSFPSQKDPPFAGVMNRQDVGVDLASIDPQSSLAQIGVDLAWRHTTGKNPDGSRVIIGVVGTGIDYTIPDLREALWINTGEIGTRASNGQDDDGNRYQDDLFGYDFFSGDGLPYDWHGHDTYTASIIAATGRTNADVRGVAPNASLLISRYISPDGTGNVIDALYALEYAIQTPGVRVIYFNWPKGGFPADPWMGDYNEVLAQVIGMAEAHNINVVIPAGNSANEDVPVFLKMVSEMPHVIIVSGTTLDNRMQPRSNSGRRWVSVAAPAEGAKGYHPGGSVNSDLNTSSVAAAHVAGAAALLATRPGYGSAAKIKQALLQSSSSNRRGEPLDVLSEGVISLSELQ